MIVQTGKNSRELQRTWSGFFLCCCFAAIFILFFSCSINYGEEISDETLSNELPKSILRNFSQTIVRDGQIALEIKAEQAEMYEEDNKTVAYAIEFVEYGEDGEKINEGRAGHGVYYSNTENAELSNSVYLYSIQEETSITADSIQWESEKRLLKTTPEITVLVKKKDGSFIEGTGFEANLRRNEIRFYSDIKGLYFSTIEYE